MVWIQVSGTVTPLTSLRGQYRTWCPQGPGHPWLTSAAWTFRAGFENSLSTLSSKTPGGAKAPPAGVVPSANGGSSDWAAPGKVLNTLVAVSPPRGSHLKVLAEFCVWNAAIWRTLTGWLRSARVQNGDSTSSPTAATRPDWFSRWPGPTTTVRKPNNVLMIWPKPGSFTSEPLCQNPARGTDTMGRAGSLVLTAMAPAETVAGPVAT